MQLSSQCRACGTINISKDVNNFLSTNPTTVILSSLSSEFCQKSKSDSFYVCVYREWRGGELNLNLKIIRFFVRGLGEGVEEGVSSVGK